jgi:hypothetical protein
VFVIRRLGLGQSETATVGTMQALESLEIVQQLRNSTDWSSFFDKVYATKSIHLAAPSNQLEEVQEAMDTLFTFN